MSTDEGQQRADGGRGGGRDVEAEDANKVDAAVKVFSTGDLAGAERVLLDVVSRTPTHYIYRFESDGKLYVKFWDLEEFVYFCTQYKDELKTQVFWRKSAYPRAHYYLGFARVKQGDLQGAIEWLDKGMELEPDQPFFRIEKGKALSGLKQYERALALYESVAKLGPKVRASIRAVALRGMGFQLIELGHLDAAEGAFLDSLTLDPDSSVARNELRYIAHLRSGGNKAAPETVAFGGVGSLSCTHCGQKMTGGRVKNVGGRLVWVCQACVDRLPPGDRKEGLSVTPIPEPGTNPPKPLAAKRWWQFWK